VKPEILLLFLNKNLPKYLKKIINIKGEKEEIDRVDWSLCFEFKIIFCLWVRIKLRFFSKLFVFQSITTVRNSRA